MTNHVGDQLGYAQIDSVRQRWWQQEIRRERPDPSFQKCEILEHRLYVDLRGRFAAHPACQSAASAP